VNADQELGRINQKTLAYAYYLNSFEYLLGTSYRATSIVLTTNSKHNSNSIEISVQISRSKNITITIRSV
jgi:hypothetical protein